MLNPFPSLLTYAFFAPTLLRLAVTIVFAYLALSHYRQRGPIARTHFPIIGAQAWTPWFAALVELALAAAFLFGFGTQWAALVGALVGLKYAFWAGKYPSLFLLSRTAALLLFAICLSLLLMGAGAFAYDLPL